MSADPMSITNRITEISRKYKMLEANNAQYAEEAKAIIKRQQTIIEKIAKENEALREEINQKTRTMKLNRVDITNQMSKLNDTADTLLRKIELERRKKEELDKQFNLLNEKIMAARKRMGGVNVSKENNLLIEKQIKVLENRLDKCLIKFNEALAYNKSLRESIDNLRRERVVFDGIYKKMERELHEKKKEMAELIEASNDAYEERDADQNELAALKLQAEKEMAMYEEKFAELERILEQDRQTKEMLKNKERERKDREVLGEFSLEEEQSIKKKVIKGNWNLAEQKVKQNITQEKAQSYEEAFEKIQIATGIKDLDELVATFINAEDSNFSLFNYVNEMNNEIEKLEEQIQDLNKELADLQKGGAGSKDSKDSSKDSAPGSDTQRTKVLKDLEEKLNATEAKTEQYQNKYNAAMKTVDALIGGIQSIFTKLGCNPDAVAEITLAGSLSGGITESNMLAYLGVIEQRTNELLLQYNAIKGTALTNSIGAQSNGSINAAGSMNSEADADNAPAFSSSGAVMIDLDYIPNTGDDDYDENSDEEEDRPLTREELTLRTQKMIANRNQMKKGITDKKNRNRTKRLVK